MRNTNRIKIKFSYLSLLLPLIIGCQQASREKVSAELSKTDDSKSIGTIIVNDPSISRYIDPGTAIEILSNGFEWSEGPLWVADGNYLLFSDIPANAIYKWSEIEGKRLYLKPSGYTGIKERGGELGSNGLLLSPEGQLVLCQHGDQRMAVMNATLDEPKSDFVTLTDNYQGLKFNSPNDAVFHSNGDLYFTDPPYGLENGMNDVTKEIDFQGVFRLDSSGKTHLITDEITRPNGIAFSPDESILYVASSDPLKPIIMAYEVTSDGQVDNGRIFFDALHLMGGGNKGLPDGLRVHSSGTVFATGPSGVLIITAEGKHLGTISTGEAISNCEFDDREQYLYATSDMYLVRVQLKK